MAKLHVFFMLLLFIFCCFVIYFYYFYLICYVVQFYFFISLSPCLSFLFLFLFFILLCRQLVRYSQVSACKTSLFSTVLFTQTFYKRHSHLHRLCISSSSFLLSLSSCLAYFSSSLLPIFYFHFHLYFISIII